MAGRRDGDEQREARALTLLSAFPLLVQLLFHVWQQSALYGGRHAFVDRIASTTGTLPTLLTIVLFVGPLAAWIVLLVRALASGRPLPGTARPGDPPIARALGGVIRYVSPIAAATLVVHVVMLWGGRLAGGEPPLWLYDVLRATTGQPLWLAFHGVFVVAITWHLAATLPDALEAANVVGEDGRRSAFVVTAVLGACLFVLYAQLAGWIGTGLGTFFPVHPTSP